MMSKFVRYPISRVRDSDLRRVRRNEMLRWLAYSLFCIGIGVIIGKLI